jgi:hypothetical protein
MEPKRAVLGVSINRVLPRELKPGYMAPEGPPVYRKLTMKLKDSIGVPYEFAWKKCSQPIILMRLPWLWR